MAQQISPNSLDLFNFQKNGWSRQNCTQENVSKLVVELFTAFVMDHNERVHAVENGNMEALNQRAWYANEYHSYLSSSGQMDRLDQFKNQGSFFHGHPPKGFHLVNNCNVSTGKAPYYYRLNQNTSPSEGLQFLFLDSDSPYFIDCRMSVQIIHYCALRIILGEDRFDFAFDPKSEKVLCLTPYSPLTPLNKFLLEEDRAPRYGDLCFFHNVAEYKVKHPDGEDSGFHVICTREEETPAYAGFGLPSPESTEQQIYEVFAESMNQPPLSFAKLMSSEHAKIELQKRCKERSKKLAASKIKVSRFNEEVKRLKDRIYTFEDIATDSRSGLTPKTTRLDVRKIKALI